MKFEAQKLSLMVYFHPLSLDCWLNRKILTEFVNTTGVDCTWVDVSQWDKKEIKTQGVEAVPRLHVLYAGNVIHKQSGKIGSPEALIGYINASCERAGLTS